MANAAKTPVSPLPTLKKSPSMQRKELPKSPTLHRPPPSPKGRRSADPWSLCSGRVVALYCFEGDDEVRIPLCPGDVIELLERGYGWYKGHNLSSDCIGIFPCSYVQPFKEDDGSSPPTPNDQVVLRCSQVVLEWGRLMNRWFSENQFSKARIMMGHIQTMLKAKADLLSTKSKPDDRRAVTKLIQNTIARCTTQLGLSFTVTNADGVYVDSLNADILDLYRLYRSVDSSFSDSKPLGRDAQAVAPVNENAFVQVYVKFNAFVCKIDDEGDSAVELLFSLYSVQKKKDITESYVVRLTNKLMVDNIDKIDMQKTIFENVELGDTLLVCRVIRLGKLAARQKTGVKFRIPFGVAAVPVSTMLNQKKSEAQLPIYLQNHQSFQTLLERIGRKETLETAKGALAVEIKVYNTPDVKTLSEDLKDFDKIAVTSMLEMDTTNLKPGVTRNDFYLMLERAEVQQEGKKTAKNVEITLSVRFTATGQVVRNCLTSGSGEELMDEYRSCVFYHDNNPVWMENVKINMDVELFSRCHVLIEARHCTTKDEKKGKLFSVTAFSLVGSAGTVVDTASKQLSLYKPPPKIPKETTYYLNPEASGMKHSREFVYVTPRLASTKLLQNPSLHKILHWQQYETEMQELLKKFTFVEKIDLVKVLDQLLPALFSMMEARSDLRLLIFDALSFLLSLLVTGRFDAFAPIVDEYFDHSFANPNTYHHIFSCLTTYFRNIGGKQTGANLHPLKGLPYWFKIIAISKKAEGDRVDPQQFVRELDSLLLLVCKLLKSKERSDLGAQMLVLKAFDQLLFDSIEPHFSDEKLSELVLRLLSWIEYDESKQSLTLEKLEVARRVMSWPVLKRRPAIRSEILRSVLGEVQAYMLRQTSVLGELSKAMDILCMVFCAINSMMRERDDETAQMPYASECTFFVPYLVQEILQNPGDHAVLAYLTLLSMMQRETFVTYCSGIPRAKAKDALLQLCRANTLLLRKPLPKNWFSMNLFKCQTVVKTLRFLRPVMMARIQSFPKEIVLWTAYFELLFDVTLLPQLQVENMTDGHKQLLLRRFGDLRVEAAMVLRKSWNEIKVLQSIFVPKFVGPFLSLVMLRQSDVREIGVDMFWTVLAREIQETNGYTVVGSATIDNLDQLSHDEEAVIDYADFESFFMSSLNERLENVEDEQKRDVFAAFFVELGSLLSIIKEIKSLPPGAEYEEERILGTMQIMAYLNNMGRKTTYIRYVQQLADMLNQSGGFVEAGLTLMLHGGQLGWTSQKLEKCGAWPEEEEGERKERIYNQVIDLFHQAKQWERCIPLMRELRHQFENVNFHYDKLSALLLRESQLFKSIIHVPRFFPTYFRVGFYGSGFSATVRNKQFIYKGLELESLTDFTARLKLVYRKAEILKTTTITPEIEQYLLVTAVNPSSEDESKGLKRKFDAKLPAPSLKYLEWNDVMCFSYSKPFRGESVAVGELDPQMKEFAGLWIRKIFMMTAETFPSYRKRLQVVSTVELEVSPIQNAVADIESKNASLAQLLVVAEKDAGQLSPLSMMLNGIIDAAVNGGTKIYTKLFLAPEYAANRPQDAPLCDQLRGLLVGQVDQVAQGLKVHRRQCPESLLGLQSKMEEFFEVLEKEMKPFGYVAQKKDVVPLSIPGLDKEKWDRTTKAGSGASKSGSATPSPRGAASTFVVGKPSSSVLSASTPEHDSQTIRAIVSPRPVVGSRKKAETVLPEDEPLVPSPRSTATGAPSKPLPNAPISASDSGKELRRGKSSGQVEKSSGNIERKGLTFYRLGKGGK